MGKRSEKWSLKRHVFKRCYRGLSGIAYNLNAEMLSACRSSHITILHVSFLFHNRWFLTSQSRIYICIMEGDLCNHVDLSWYILIFAVVIHNNTVSLFFWPLHDGTKIPQGLWRKKTITTDLSASDFTIRLIPVTQLLYNGSLTRIYKAV